jgi:immune inhibitor A
MFYVTGGITNPLRMPSTYAYYEGGASGIGIATPRSQELVLNAIDAANTAGVNFQDYDHDNDGFIDGLVIIHAGLGAETGGFGIWSHKFHLPSTISRDGVQIYDYTMNPEEFPGAISPIGVICHEFGHTFGLPDLYDIDYQPETSEGLGNWSIMASGTYNFNGRRPAHFDAWCKARIGFLSLINVTANLDNAVLPAVEYSPVAYKLKNAASQHEYWVVENRRKKGFDLNIPGEGLLIYHVDTLAPANNIDVNRYYVALEQADGDLDLEFTLNNVGDAGDPFPGSTNNREFHDYTTPSDVTNFSAFVYPHIGVMDISNSDSVMYADLDISFSRNWSRSIMMTPWEIMTAISMAAKLSALISPPGT